MDAKTRYRRRLKLQAALARVLEVLAANVGDGIPPDRASALLAWQAVVKLAAFIEGAGVEPPAGSDLSRAVHILRARHRETRARYRRREKRRTGGAGRRTETSSPD